MFFTQELSTLVNSGLPLDRSLAICKELSGKKKLQHLADEILQDLKRGKTLADSLAAHPRVFSKLYVNMVRAGEAGGALPLVLERLVEFQQSADELRSYLISSLIYPALLTMVGAASIVVLLNYVIPRFAEIFDEAGRALPLPTQILLGVSGVHPWLLVGLPAGPGRPGGGLLPTAGQPPGTDVVGRAQAKRRRASERSSRRWRWPASHAPWGPWCTTPSPWFRPWAS